MADTTTIKVSRAVHQRLTERAAARDISLGSVIEQALEESDTERFWAQVRIENAALSQNDRESALPTISDDLADANDDDISAREAW